MPGSYRIFETDQFLRTLNRLEAQIRRRIEEKLTGHVYPQLRAQPFHGANIRKLRGYVPDTWRYRIGKYRLFYAISDEDKVVAMLSVDDRKDAYK